MQCPCFDVKQAWLVSRSIFISPSKVLLCLCPSSRLAKYYVYRTLQHDAACLSPDEVPPSSLVGHSYMFQAKRGISVTSWLHSHPRLGSKSSSFRSSASIEPRGGSETTLTGRTIKPFKRMLRPVATSIFDGNLGNHAPVKPYLLCPRYCFLETSTCQYWSSWLE